MVKVPEWKLDAFDWLPIERWTPQYLLTDTQVNGKRYCKVCDEWVEKKDEKTHTTKHRQQRREMMKRRKIAALKKAREERARKRLLEQGPREDD